MPLDVQSALLATAKSLLLTYAPVTADVKPGNVITPDSPRFSEHIVDKTQPGDFPQIALYLPSMQVSAKQMTPIDDDPALMDMPIELALRMDYTITHDSTVSTAQTPIEAATLGAFLRRGRKLGLQWVLTSTDESVSRREEFIGGTNRTVARRRLVVTARVMRSLLTATT